MTDEEIIKGLKSRDNLTIGYLYKEYFYSVSYMLTKMGADKSVCSDIFQNTLIIVINYFDTKDTGLKYSFKTFFFAICKKNYLTLVRKNEIHNKFLTQQAKAEYEEQPEKFDQDILEKLVSYHFDRLDESCRNILRMYHEGLSPEEIAQKINSTNGYVRKRKSLCTDKLVNNIRSDPKFNELKNNNVKWPDTLNI